MNISERAVESGKIFRWLKELEENPLQYYQVELSDNSSGTYAPLMLSESYVAGKDLDPSVKMFELAEQKLILNMLIDGVIHQGETAAGCNWRLKLLGWYKSLSQEEKLALPIFGNKLKLSKSVVPAFVKEAIKSGYSRYESVRLAYDDINADLQSLGTASASYMTVKERIESKGEFVPQENALVDFKRLQMLDFAALDGLEKSSEDRPFNDLKHAFATASLGTTSDSGASNYHEGFKWLTRLLTGQGFSGMEPLTEFLDPFSLPLFRSYLERHIVEGTLSPITATTLVSAVRSTLTTIKNIKGYAGSDFINCQGFDADRVTDAYRPYSSAERVRISTSVNEDIEHYNTLAQPYQRSGIGEDPIDAKGSLRPGCNTLENARWIFENKLGCVHVGYDQKDSEDPHVRAFLSIVSRSGMGLREIVERWGVHYLVDAQVITPYAIKLAQVTGLNADSIKLLDVDDYEPKHPLTGRPCLRYWKERSDGEKLMHLDIFEADITWLTTSQSYAVAQIFEDIKALTAKIRVSAPQVMRDKLFIWQSSARKSFMEIKSFATGKDGALGVAFAAYGKRKGFVDSNGQPLNLTPARLRPSFISELVERDVPVREIQLILGHKHIETTLAYLDRMDFNYIARSKLDVALRELHESAAELADSLSSSKAEANLIDVVNLDGPQVVFKTPLASCRNIFNPPEFIKKLSSYVPGSPCALYNMCLGCENVLLTASNLPELFAMERDYLTLNEISRIMDTPYGRVVRENLALLDGILHSKSDFTPEELAEGRRLSEFVDTTVLVDGVAM
ncbi:tyrosine-type recombinase/integrase [Pseudomonas orientalis]|uniref:Phage integrase family protein n=1 Tax=Pseudomonas orientalis TaxID=76758 RepID=A0A1H2G9C2_9PSED|nr:tyrosine-type recombinase/integrase [Pseudomonas orientalis]KRP65410.1 integrase [Pseudomonas orientalis]SDU16243.1 Phage integrase family protein [Pseudomonas orientalis]